MSEPNSPMNMLPFTKAPRFPNMGLTSTRGSSGTSDWKRSLSSSVGFGIFMSATSADDVGEDRQEVGPPGVVLLRDRGGHVAVAEGEDGIGAVGGECDLDLRGPRFDRGNAR